MLIQFSIGMKSRMKRRIVTTTAVFEAGYPAETASERLKRLGFEAQDIALDYWKDAPASPFMGDDYLAWAKALGRQAEQLGIPYTHSHAPEEAGEHPIIARSLETAAALGARYMVLHPVCGQNGRFFEEREEFLRANERAIAPWLGMARDCGVVTLSENLLWGPSRDPRVIAELVRRVGSEWFGWCYDMGHANCFGYRPEVLRECAVVPLSLHIQDNHASEQDEHLIPGDGTIDWDALARTLGEIGYAGDCVLEAHHQSLTAPDGERDTILARLLAAARVLRDRMDAYAQKANGDIDELHE